MQILTIKMQDDSEAQALALLLRGMPKVEVSLNEPKPLGVIDISSNYDVRHLPGTPPCPEPLVVKGKSWTL
jgi:2-keto-3-deoxy-6-phosphogluconate aldolase